MNINNKYTPQDIDELEHQLEMALKAYELGEPLISDDEYDHFKRVLIQLRPNSKFLSKIGNKPKRNVETLPYILGSLTNKFEDDIQSWLDKNDNGSGFVLSHKLDGVAIECEYTNGKLTGAWLRGDHYKGENITAKALKFVPNTINEASYKNNKQYFKGEILLNCEPETIGYKTKRNAAAGIINRDDYVKLQYLYVIFHTYIPPAQMICSEIERLNHYMSTMFNHKHIIQAVLVKKDMVIPLAKQMIEQKTSYDKDGIIITVNDSEVENVKLPEKKVAFKFNKMSVEAEVIKVEWNTSRTGKIIPVIIVKPVILGGATIQRATGFHAKFIYDNDIGPGAVVKLVRSGDVIPYIEQIIKSGSVIDLIGCPTCGNKELTTDETKTHLYCSNLNCPAQTQKRITYFFEKLGLENFSEKMISSLGCESILDVYNLKKEDILKLDGWAETSTVDFLNRIEQTKKARPENVLAALGIENLGNTTAKLILENISFEEILKSLDNPQQLNILLHKLVQVKGLGAKKVTSITKGLKENKELLKSFNLFTSKNTKQISGPLTGKRFCITGKLSNSRKNIEKLIETHGGIITSINSCNYLVCNEPSNSSKYNTAVEKGINIVNETELSALIQGDIV